MVSRWCNEERVQPPVPRHPFDRTPAGCQKPSIIQGRQSRASRFANTFRYASTPQPQSTECNSMLRWRRRLGAGSADSYARFNSQSASAMIGDSQRRAPDSSPSKQCDEGDQHTERQIPRKHPQHAASPSQAAVDLAKLGLQGPPDPRPCRATTKASSSENPRATRASMPPRKWLSNSSRSDPQKGFSRLQSSAPFGRRPFYVKHRF